MCEQRVSDEGCRTLLEGVDICGRDAHDDPGIVNPTPDELPPRCKTSDRTARDVHSEEFCCLEAQNSSKKILRLSDAKVKRFDSVIGTVHVERRLCSCARWLYRF